jgi:hypothetical protein
MLFRFRIRSLRYPCVICPLSSSFHALSQKWWVVVGEVGIQPQTLRLAAAAAYEISKPSLD